MRDEYKYGDGVVGGEYKKEKNSSIVIMSVQEFEEY